MIATDLYTPTDPAQQDHRTSGPAVDRAPSSNSTTLSIPGEQQQEHRSSHDPPQGPAANSAGNPIECRRDSSSSNTHHEQDNRAGSSDVPQHDSSANQLTPSNDLNPTEPSHAAGPTEALTTTLDAPSAPSSHLPPPCSNIDPAPTSTCSNIDPNINMTEVKSENPAMSHDPALDEDAPHEDDDEGSESESAFVNLSTSTGHAFQDDSIDSSLAQNSFHPYPQTSNHDEIDQKPEIPPTTDASTRKRKRTSDQNGSATTPARRESSRPKATARVKSAEQIEREALIEQQNPHATKNQLRSLKLRALHAIRIAERELNMSEAEKQRRLRLREYVRHKREEERSLKSSGKQPNASEADLPHPQEKAQATGSRLPSAASHPTHSAPSLVNGSSDNQSVANGQSSDSKRKATKNSEKTPKGKSAPRVKRSVASLEAEIKKRNPNASPTQLKSLKLRALHAERIAEREQNMSEKDKVRRQKLREYMRRRREEERVEKGQEPIELSLYDEAKVAADSTFRYQRSLDSGTSMNGEAPAQPHEGSMTELGGAPLVPEGMNADDRLAAFSMMELTNNYQHQFAQSHQPHAPSTNLHLHPLFQMPMGQSSSEGPSPYDCQIHPGYAPMTEQWSHVPAPDARLPTDEVGEKALHAALEEAIYMKPHSHHHHHQQIPFDGQHHAHYSPNEQAAEADRLARLEQERIQLAEDEILGIERARELAMIAAAAAEVEHAQQMAGSTSSHHLH
ncbi:hypothetical protein PtB15_2B679 [Puccinia triticina]|nr:hypothetical protein PtB15_2B679 [Puccinia triticina]